LTEPAAARGLDASRPLLAQAPLLSDDQVRAAFRPLDPFADPGIEL
jgi:hypothetical protein